MKEPVLRDEDHRAWALWMAEVRMHARTRAHAARVHSAMECARVALEQHPDACIMWSGGKDSTAMVHLVCVGLGARVPVFSEKDDLDYPGELEYVQGLGAQWGLDLRVVAPPMSPRAWMAANGHALGAYEDLHGRSAGLSKECFYGVVEAATESFACRFLGLRQEESDGRKASRAKRGRLYELASGKWHCTPIADWDSKDVYAYLDTHGVPLLDVYRCIAFAHKREPGRVRKSWWVPGASARHGGTAWLRHYYPSLFRQLCDWVPCARALT